MYFANNQLEICKIFFPKGETAHFCSMEAETKRDWKKEKAEKRYSVCLANGELVGIWGNLKKLCEDMKEQDGEFLTYHSLSRRRANENPMKFETERGEYAVYIEKIR